MLSFIGTVASGGLVMGPACRLRRGSIGLGRIVQDPSRERALVDAAIVLAKDELEEMQKHATGDEKDILQFQRLLLEDSQLMNEVGDYIAAGAGGAAAVERAAKIFAGRISRVDDDYIRLRSADVVDACRRVVDILDGRPRAHLNLVQPSIIVGEEIFPSDILSVERRMILGLAISAGSTQSHVSIIARTLNLPAVVDLGDEFLEQADGRMLALDAERGVATLDPSPVFCQDFAARKKQQEQRTHKLEEQSALPCCTRDGTEFELLGNCSDPSDIEAVVAMGASGVGLLRSEYFYMQGTAPDEETQYQFYCDCLQAAQGRPVTVRTMDLGADKRIEGLTMEKEENPALGLRGVRFSFEHEDLFLQQLCALYRAAAKGKMRVMFPMIGDVEDWKRALACAAHARDILRARGAEFDEQMDLGSMIEVPSAALCADELAAAGCKFFSIGTNDLVQYTHAADRLATNMQTYYRKNSSAVRRLIAMVVSAAQKTGTPLCVCGITAADPALAEEYIRMGIRSLSMVSQSLLPVKERLRRIALTAAETELVGAKG